MAWSKGWIAVNPSSSVTSTQASAIAGLGSSTATVAEINSVCDGLAATAAEINNKCDGSLSYQSTGAGTTYAVLAANTGKLHQMVAIGGSQTATLPTAAAGLNYKFVYFSTADEAQDFIIKSPSATNYFRGGVMHSDTDGDTVATVYSNGSSNDFFTMVKPGAGTEVNLLCDGTVWYIWGIVCSATVPAFSDT